MPSWKTVVACALSLVVGVLLGRGLPTGKAEFCYVERDGGGVVLVAALPWELDREVIYAPRLEELMAFAGRIGCEVKP